MKKIFNFIKNNWLVILVILSLLLTIINKIIKGPASNRVVEITPTPSTTINYKAITPGKTSLDEAESILGSPLKQTQNGDTILAEFASTNKYRNNFIYAQKGTVVLIKEMVIVGDPQEARKAKDITSVLGTAPFRLYRQEPQSFIDLYVYPSNGIAYLGGEDGSLSQIWYFKPTTIEDFSYNWAQGYSSDPFTGQNAY